jgi:hypothetical protein
VIRLGQIGTETGTVQLSTLLSQLNASHGAVLPPPSPSEAMAIYSVAVRLAELQLALTDGTAAPVDDLEMTRDVLLGTRKMLRAALARIEPEPTSPRLVLIDGG